VETTDVDLFSQFCSQDSSDGPWTSLIRRDQNIPRISTGFASYPGGISPRSRKAALAVLFTSSDLITSYDAPLRHMPYYIVLPNEMTFLFISMERMDYIVTAEISLPSKPISLEGLQLLSV
jgi:hypothetical protein